MLERGIQHECKHKTDMWHCLRAGEAPSTGLTESLIALGFETDRLKTGTPARVDARTVNFDVLEKQPGDEDVRWFSFDPEASPESLLCSLPQYIQIPQHKCNAITFELTLNACLSLPTLSEIRYIV